MGGLCRGANTLIAGGHMIDGVLMLDLAGEIACKLLVLTTAILHFVYIKTEK